MTTGDDLGAICRRAHLSGDYDSVIARIPYARYLGVRMRMDGDRPRFWLPFKDMLVGTPIPAALHGGVVAAFMENAAMLHLLMTLETPRIPKSVDFSIDYLRGAQPRTLHAACQVQRLGRRVAQVQIQALQHSERQADADNTQAPTDAPRTVALARAHFLLSPPE